MPPGHTNGNGHVDRGVAIPVGGYSGSGKKGFALSVARRITLSVGEEFDREARAGGAVERALNFRATDAGQSGGQDEILNRFAPESSSPGSFSVTHQPKSIPSPLRRELPRNELLTLYCTRMPLP